MPDSLTAPAALTSTFVFPAARLADAEKRVAKYARKAERLGLAAPTMRVAAEFDRTIFVSRTGQIVGRVEGFAPVNPQAHYTIEPLVRVEVTGERPIVAGWEFAATIEHTGEGNFVWSVPGADVPREYRDASATYCDHCRTHRQRNKTYVVRNVETGAYKRVGSSCLQDHLGEASPDVWLSCYQFVRDMEGFESDEDAGFDGVPAIVAPTLVFMAAVVSDVRGYGFVSSGAAREGSPATGSRVLGLLTGRETWQAARDTLTADDYAKARECLAWLAQQDDENGFIYNAQLAARLSIVEHKTCKLLAAVVPKFDRELIAQVTAATKLNEHLNAEVGARRVLDLIVTRCTGYYNNFDTYIHRINFEDCEGRTFTWKTSNATAVAAVDGEDYDVGESFRVLGTVKAFGEYRGTLQTELSRCKLYPQGSDAKPLAAAMRKICKAQSVDAPSWALTPAQAKRAAKAAAK